MKQRYESDFRPNFELRQSFVWFVCGLAAAAFLVYRIGLDALTVAYLTSFFFVVGLFYSFQASRRVDMSSRLRNSALKFMDLPALTKVMKDGELFIGYGFDWTASCAQKVSDLYNSHDEFDAIRAQGDGATYLHGLGPKKEQAVYLSDDETKGHTLIIGTTGAGKTRLLDLIVSQCVSRGEPTIIIDPKGDHELMSNCQSAFARAGREEDFSFFHPAFPDESCAIDPLANYQRESELASRIAAIIPGDGQSEVFKSYSQNALMSVFYGIIAGGEQATILDIHQPLTLGASSILLKAVAKWAHRNAVELPGAVSNIGEKADTEKKRAQMAAAFYQSSVLHDETLRDHDLDGLVALHQHDQAHFSKMVASLIPVIGQLCSGSLKQLLSPSVQKNRLPKSGKVINLANVIRSNQGVYIGLDTLSDAIVGSRIGQLVLSDLTALAGAKYNFGGGSSFVNVIVDEASEVVTEQLIQLLNKGRGAKFRIIIATQTLADLEARSGSKAIQQMMVGNLNAVVMLRTINPDTQASLAEQLPLVPVSYVMKSASTSLASDAADAGFGVSHGERLMQEEKPIIAPQTFGDLSDLEYFVRTPRGRILKGRLPILEGPGGGDNKSKAARSVELDR